MMTMTIMIVGAKPSSKQYLPNAQPMALYIYIYVFHNTMTLGIVDGMSIDIFDKSSYSITCLRVSTIKHDLLLE